MGAMPALGNDFPDPRPHSPEIAKESFHTSLVIPGMPTTARPEFLRNWRRVSAAPVDEESFIAPVVNDAAQTGEEIIQPIRNDAIGKGERDRLDPPSSVSRLCRLDVGAPKKLAHASPEAMLRRTGRSSRRLADWPDAWQSAPNGAFVRRAKVFGGTPKTAAETPVLSKINCTVPAHGSTDRTLSLRVRGNALFDLPIVSPMPETPQEFIWLCRSSPASPARLTPALERTRLLWPWFCADKFCRTNKRRDIPDSARRKPR
jgi:hypothetical protein